MLPVCIVRRVVVINRATQSEAGCMLTVKYVCLGLYSLEREGEKNDVTYLPRQCLLKLLVGKHAGKTPC